MSNENDYSKGFFIDSEDTEKLKDYQYPPIPEPQYCSYCNKKLGWKGLTNPLIPKRIFSWCTVVDCDCEEYQKNKELKIIQ